MPEPSVTDQIQQLAALLTEGDVKTAADLLAHLRTRWRHETQAFSPAAVLALQEQLMAKDLVTYEEASKMEVWRAGNSHGARNCSKRRVGLGIQIGDIKQ